MKIGRVKFAVKKIGYANQANKMEVDKTSADEKERGHSANSIFDKPNDELFEEFEEIEKAFTEETTGDNDDEDENKCRFCW